MDTIDIVGIEKKLTKFYNEAIINPANGNAHIMFDNRLSIKLPLTLEKIYRNVVIKFKELNTINPFVYDEINNIFTCYYPKGKSYNTITLDSNMFQIEGMDYVKVGTIYTNTFKDKDPTRKIVPSEISITIDPKKQGEFLQENISDPYASNEILDVNKWLQFSTSTFTPELQYLMIGMGALMYQVPVDFLNTEELVNDPDVIKSLDPIDPAEFYASIVEVIDRIRYYEEVDDSNSNKNSNSININIDIILYILIFIVVLIAIFYFYNKNKYIIKT